MFSYTEKISAILIVKERILTAYSLDSPYKNIWFLVLLLKENKKYFLKYIKNKWHILSMSIYIYFKEIVSITGESSCASLTKICFHFITDYILLSPLKSCMYFCGVWPISGTHSQEQKKNRSFTICNIPENQTLRQIPKKWPLHLLTDFIPFFYLCLN